MFKVGRWKHEKIKVPFSLQFQATQLPCSKSKLMISLIPMDVGQPTVRLKKAVVQNGTCTWENPVYETVKFTREIKTGIIQDKFYQFIISAGSSKKGFFGDVLVNFVDFLDATTPTLIYQPINSSVAGAILHITIQNMQGPDDQRELQRDIDENGGSISNEGSLQDQDLYYNTMDALDDEDWSNRRNGNKKKPESKDTSTADKNQRMRKPLILDWSSEDDLMNYVEDTDKSSLTEQEREQEPPKSLVEQLKNEVFNLKRQAEVTDLELLSLRRQVTKESTRAQELSEQVVRVREEREAFRIESEKYRSELNAEKGIEHPKEMATENKKLWHNQNEDAVDLVHAKELNRALHSQLRKTQDSHSELILVVRDLEEKLGKKEKELVNLTTKVRSHCKPDEFQDEDSDSSEYELFGEQEASSPNIDSKEVNVLEQQIRNLKGELEDHLKEKRKLQEQIKQFSQDFVVAKKENEDLSSKFNQKQLELIKKERECTQNMRTVEELESQISRLEKMIQKQADEYCESSNIIHDLEMRVKSLKRELEKREAEFEDELKAIINVNVELEQRAIQPEDHLRRMELDNGSVDQKLQEEFSELSKELETKFKENEELAAKSEAEARELKLHITILEERLEKATKELQLVEDQCEADIGKLLRKSKERENELEELLLAHKNESVELENMKRKVEDKCEALSNENQALRIEVERLTEENYNFTKMLQETNTLVDEMKNLFQETKQDREELERKYTIARTEIDQVQEELKVLRSLKEKDYAMGEVQSELESLQVQHKELKTILSETRLDNENLRKQLTQQKEDLQKKDQELANLENIKLSSSKELSTLKEKVKQLKAVKPFGISENGNKVEETKPEGEKLQPSANSSKPLQNGGTRTTGNRRETLTEKSIDSQTSDLLSEVALLKEKNKTMEDELREMQEKYSDMSLKFAEVEGERQQLVMTIRNLRNRQK